MPTSVQLWQSLRLEQALPPAAQRPEHVVGTLQAKLLQALLAPFPPQSRQKLEALPALIVRLLQDSPCGHRNVHGWPVAQTIVFPLHAPALAQTIRHGCPGGHVTVAVHVGPGQSI